MQAQILNLMLRIQAERDLAYVFVSHDLHVVRHMSDHMIVMYLGTVGETGPTEEVFTRALHPYTEALLSAVPDPDHAGDRVTLEGEIPDPAQPVRRVLVPSALPTRRPVSAGRTRALGDGR